VIDQLDQLKEFSDKYKQNSIQAGDAIIRSTEVLTATHQTIERLNLFVEGMNKIAETEAEKLDILKQEVTTTIAAKVVELQAKVDALLQSLTKGFLHEQNKHEEAMISTVNKAEKVVTAFNSDVNQKLLEVKEQTEHLQLQLKSKWEFNNKR
jgi:hypothetical protein